MVALFSHYRYNFVASGNGRDFRYHPGFADGATYRLCPPQLLENFSATDIQLFIFRTLFGGPPANIKSIALLWNRGMRHLSIIACLVLKHKGKSRSSAPIGNSDWTGSWGDLGGVWHLALPFGEYFRKFWYPHLQWFQRSTDNCGKLHVRIILGHPIVRDIWESIRYSSSCWVNPRPDRGSLVHPPPPEVFRR